MKIFNCAIIIVFLGWSNSPIPLRLKIILYYGFYFKIPVKQYSHFSGSLARGDENCRKPPPADGHPSDSCSRSKWLDI